MVDLAMNFWIWYQKQKLQKAKLNKLDHIKLQSFCTEKETVNKMNRQSTEWVKIFANHLSDKGLIPPICKELMWLSNIDNDKNNPIKSH